MAATEDRDAWKRAAAERAIASVRDGMVLGLGSGSTAEIAVALLAERVRAGLRVTGISTSERTRGLASRLGIPLTGFDAHAGIDLAIDGADQVERGTLNLVKGLGGALLREKIVAASARRMIVIVDESKLVPRLGGRTPLPVEIAAFGWPSTVARLEAAGYRPTLRRTDGAAFTTDGGNHIADCAIAEIADPRKLEAELHAVPGVVETGLFIGMASAVIVGGTQGVEELAP
jgi:ribose 5-phosphate isomerase A